MHFCIMGQALIFGVLPPCLLCRQPERRPQRASQRASQRPSQPPPSRPIITEVDSGDEGEQWQGDDEQLRLPTQPQRQPSQKPAAVVAAPLQHLRQQQHAEQEEEEEAEEDRQVHGACWLRTWHFPGTLKGQQLAACLLSSSRTGTCCSCRLAPLQLGLPH